MAYLLKPRIFLDDFFIGENSIDLYARANVTEVNAALSGIYGCPPKFLDCEANFHHYGFGDVEARYWLNGTLTIKLTSKKAKELERIKSYIVHLRKLV